jgi:dolichol-phosphate mannosyltransferase
MMSDTERVRPWPESIGLSIVIPAYDELLNLRELIPAIHRSTRGLAGVSTEILVVLPSFAPSAEVQEIEALGGRAVSRGPSDSFGDAIRSGFRALGPSATFVITMDADGSHDPATIPTLMAAPQSADVVVASRYTAGGQTDNSFVLRLMSRSLNLAYGIALDIKCRDVSTNFKRYRASDLSQLELTSRDFDIVEELLFRVKVLHGKDFSIAEVPDHFLERRHGVTKRKLGPFIVSYVTTLVRLRWRMSRISK